MRTDEAIVLVGGLGTRLRSVVSDVPKPLAPVAGRPFLAWVLDGLAAQGIRRVILATGYMSGVVEEVVGERWGQVEVVYSVEDEPLGTGGAVRNALARLQGDAVHVANGDTFLRYSLSGLEDAAALAGAFASIALARVDDVSRYGAVETGADGRVVAFREKGRAGPGLINAGCYFLGRDALHALPSTPVFSLETDFLVPHASQGRLSAYTHTEAFIDIGVPEDFARAQGMFGARA